MKLVDRDDPILKNKTEPYTGDFKSLRPLAFEMFNNMKKWGGIGLAAPQIGEDLRMFVMKGYNSWGFRDAIVAINPSIDYLSPEKHNGEEGCLSFPGDVVQCERPAVVYARYTDIKGVEWENILTQSYARCFLHELDHLNGITMHERGELKDE